MCPTIGEVGISPLCARCGRAAAPTDRFCGGCGTPVLASCQQCGHTLPPDAAFCTNCGAHRADNSAASSSPPRAEDRRRVSVLFIDLVGFTPYVEHSDPELVRQLQTGFFETARQVISRYGGVVEKYIGDAVMALFGAPVATETDAVRCVRAGLELQRTLARLGPTDAVRPRFRVGVATGEALVDVAAARDGGQAIVAGDVVNTAARLQAAAPADGVLVCGVTHAATRTAIRYEEHQPILLRGRSTQTEVWLALAPAGMTHRDPGTAIPLVNRTHELSLLINALDRALRENRPQLVTMLGHAGIGKSRLTRELLGHTERLFSESIIWHTGHCPPFGENVTYAAFAEIVKAYAGILDTDTEEIARDRLATALTGIVEDGEVTRLLDALSPLIGVQGTKVSADESESAWRRFVVAMAGKHPTVLVFEDLHWADESMLRFIELLGASVREVPLLLLCTARPELVAREPTWASATGGTLTITLPPLRDAEIATMYAHLLGQATFPVDSLGPLVELAHGNPLYAHEYTRMLAERGVLNPAEALRLDEGVPMPDSVHAVIANRIDLLDAADRAILQAASVVGMEFWPGAVAAAIGRPVDSVDRSLRRLEQRDLIRERQLSTMADQPEYRFGHVLMRDVCYQRLPRTERIARHERTADWLDTVCADRATDDIAEVIAHHRYTAHEIARGLGLDVARFAEPARAATHRAARRAYALHALDTASSLTGRALALCDEHTNTIEQLRLELLATEIAFYAGGDAFLAGGGSEQLSCLAERLDAAGDRACAARAWTLRGQAAWFRADRRSALAYVGRAVKLYADLPDSQEKAEAFAELGRLHMLNYEHDPAVAAASAASEIAERLGLVEVGANAKITIGTARYQAGNPRGLTELWEVADDCRERRLLTLVRAVQNLGSALIEEGDWPGCEALLAKTAPVIPGGHNLTTGFSKDCQRAWFAGDWPALLVAVEVIYASPSREWDLQARGLRSWIGLLRDPEPAIVDGVPGLLAAGERSGFHRLRWSALAHAALTRALQGYPSEASDLLSELAARWREVKAIATGEWVPAAAAAAVLTGRSATTAISGALAEVPHRTPWVDAAMHLLAGTLAPGDQAIGEFAAAAQVYGSIPNQTERALAITLALRATGWHGPSDHRPEAAAAADPHPMAALAGELRRFADRNQANRLLDLAGICGSGGG
ncbi:MAG: AAA family ATPase [Micromonosporaceae bacterium]|nr:AAA family ATPase [Micromonosporaceae bacterium]